MAAVADPVDYLASGIVPYASVLSDIPHLPGAVNHSGGDGYAGLGGYGPGPRQTWLRGARLRYVRQRQFRDMHLPRQVCQLCQVSGGRAWKCGLTNRSMSAPNAQATRMAPFATYQSGYTGPNQAMVSPSVERPVPVPTIVIADQAGASTSWRDRLPFGWGRTAAQPGTQTQLKCHLR